MKLSEIIEAVDAYKPNSFTNQQKTDWINKLEAKIYTQVLLISETDFTPMVYASDADDELMVDDAHSDVYEYWLQAQIDYHHGEYDRYNASGAMFNQAFSEYKRHIAFAYAPANSEDNATSLYNLRQPGTVINKNYGSITFENTSGEAVYLGTVPANCIITKAVCIIDEAFNSSSGDAIVLGTSADDDAYLASTDITPDTLGDYQKNLWSETSVFGKDVYAKLTVSGTAATTGQASFYIEYMEE